jgi:hypothetical protein
MGHSYPRFRGRDIRVNDGSLQIWLHLMVGELAGGPGFDELSSYWSELARAPYSGWLSPDFDELLLPDLLERVRMAAGRVAGRTGVLSRLELEEEGIGGKGAEWTSDLNFDVLRDDLRALQQLLACDGASET